MKVNSLRKCHWKNIDEFNVELRKIQNDSFETIIDFICQKSTLEKKGFEIDFEKNLPYKHHRTNLKGVGQYINDVM